LAVSLGSYDTLISCSGSSTSSEISDEEQQRMGLSPGLLRVAIGYTGLLEDRLAQIERAMKKSGLCA
jgi:methionine-gamma-lyase